MKKITIVLSAIAVTASALFVSCIKPNTIVAPPAFPAEKIATIVEKQSAIATYDYSWEIEPNYDWTATIDEASREHIQFLTSVGYSNPEYGYTISGLRGRNILYINILKTPAEGEEAVTVNINISMCGEVRPLATFTIDPYKYIEPIFPELKEQILTYDANSEDLYNYSWTIEPNYDWTATIEEDASEYIEFLTTPLDSEEHAYDSMLRGKSGLNNLYIHVKKAPASGDEPFIARINIEMEGQKKPLAEFTIQPAVEE